jgi:ketosteroid isomerase-like protein
MKLLLVLIAISILIGCKETTTKVETGSRESAIEAIRKAESDFEEMVKAKGIAEGFSFFADSTAVIKRQNDTLVHGKAGIHQYYSNPVYKNASVTWKPDFIDVSASGDMGYTYGKYSWKVTDSSGKSSTFNGVFHTVWKKQTDGSWRYVWD